MKKFEQLGRSLTKQEQKQIKGGDDQNQDIEGGNGCIADGKACGLFKDCCNTCLSTFKCGK